MYAMIALLSEGKYNARNREVEATTVRIACSNIGYLKRFERIKRSFATPAGFGSVGIGTVQFQQKLKLQSQVEASNRRLSPSDRGNV